METHIGIMAMNVDQLTCYTRQLFAYVATLTDAQRKMFYAGIQLEPVSESIRQIGPVLSGIFDAAQNPVERVYWTPVKADEIING